MALRISPEPIARLSARRPWIIIGLWVVLLVIGIGLRATLFEDGVTAEFDFTNEPESKRGDNLLEEKLRGPKGTREVVIVQSDTLTVDDPAFQAFVVSLNDDLVALGPEIIKKGTLSNYYQGKDSFLLSDDRHTTLLPFTMAGDFDDSSDNIEKVIEVVEEARDKGTLKVLITGQATVGQDFEKVAQDGLLKPESTEGRPWGQPLKKLEGAPVNLG